MAVNKTSKRSTKGGRKGKSKKVVDAMARKEWYDVIAPANFKGRQFAKTIGNKTVGNKIGADAMLDRVYEANLADLNKSNERDEPFRNVKFQVKEVQGRNLLTQFYGMDLTTDRTRSLLRKWCTTIESVIDTKTADGYQMRLFVICFTKKSQGQLSKNCYAKTRLVKWLRHRMTTMTVKRMAKQNITKAVSDLTHDVLSDALFKRCNTILPIRDVKIRKVKVIKAPKFDNAVHGEVPESKEGLVPEVAFVEEVAPAPTAVETTA